MNHLSRFPEVVVSKILQIGITLGILLIGAQYLEYRSSVNVLEKQFKEQAYQTAKFIETSFLELIKVSEGDMEGVTYPYLLSLGQEYGISVKPVHSPEVDKGYGYDKDQQPNDIEKQILKDGIQRDWIEGEYFYMGIPAKNVYMIKKTTDKDGKKKEIEILCVECHEKPDGSSKDFVIGVIEVKIPLGPINNARSLLNIMTYIAITIIVVLVWFFTYLIFRTEKKLKHSEETFRDAFDHAPTGMAFVRFDDQYLRVNRAFCNMVGYSAEELLRMKSADITHPDDLELSLRSRKKLLKELHGSLEKRYMHKNGTVVEAIVSTVVERDQRKNHLHIIAQILDITERKEAEEARGTFLANMSHELKTPLTSILGSLPMLENPFYGSLTQEQGRIIERVKRTGEHLLTIISDLLDLTQVKSGKMKLDYELCFPKEFIEPACRMVETSAKEKKIEILVKGVKGLQKITCDRLRCQQIMQNLLSNAIKFTSDSGQIIVRCFIEKEFLWVEVSDTGEGIKEDYLEKIFDPFYRPEYAKRKDVKGTGIGLSLTKSLVELHNGEIGAKSKIGKGSTFWFTLPLLLTSEEEIK